MGFIEKLEILFWHSYVRVFFVPILCH